VSSGTWTATVPTGLANGTYDISVSATDAAGDVGSASATGGLVVNVASTNTLPFSISDNAWQTLSSGVRIWDVTTGSGTAAAANGPITVNYIGYTISGSTPFNNSFTAGKTFSATLSTTGATPLIAGWVDGIPGMMPGGERRLDIPAALAYANNPPSGIPDGAELFFDINLISVS
jgi:FKBP-type peptidyl-prolyl cis-trans isomerase